MSEAQVEALTQPLIDSSIAWARAAVPNYEDLPKVTQAALADMAYNLGEHGLSNFKNAITALQREAYIEAAAAFRASAWYIQTGTRAKVDCSLIESGAAV